MLVKKDFKKRFPKSWAVRNFAYIILSIVIIFCLALSLYATRYFYITFAKSPISNDPANWGLFGDYFGGTLNPIFSLINICITIWLTLLINRLANYNSNAQINITRQVTLMQLRHESLNNLRNKLNDDFDKWRSNTDDLFLAKSCLRTLNLFSINYDYLFDTKGIAEYQNLEATINHAVYSIQNKIFASIMSDYSKAYGEREALYSELGRRTISNSL
jgi:hypothetical protein